MSSQQQRARAVFNACLRADTPHERAAIIERDCAGDDALQSAVVNLLEVYEANGSFLEEPPQSLLEEGNEPAIAATIAMPPATEQPGSKIGPYKLLQQIGEGGFGVVYMAQQTQPVRRKVALKIIKAGMDTKEVIARFEAERQALALMDHPNIAKVLDAGTTGEPGVSASGSCETADRRDPEAYAPGSSGRPYFVMELVHGVPMTQFCDDNKLTTVERLHLFVAVCRAVQHAHQKGIIHRDLKPSNILISMNDDKPMPKVIDFGISKALSQQLTEKTLFTAYGQMVGTPLYMSPEQAQFNVNDVDTRSDVYSLGVLLYELLTGHTPFDRETLQKSGFDEMRRMIREVDPPRPSARISTLHAEMLSTVSDKRKADPRKMSQSLRGELDWIVMKALEKDRNRRYESASAFAADVDRYLEGDAVLACPPSVGYRLKKAVRKHRVALTTALAVMLALAVGTVISTWQAIRASRAEADALAGWNAEEERRKEAEAAQERAEDAEKFLVSAFRSPDPRKGGRELKVIEMLKSAVKKIDKEVKGERTQARLLDALGRTYIGLGLNAEAVALLERALAIRNRLLSPTHKETLSTKNNLALAYHAIGRHQDSIGLHEQSLKFKRETLGANHADTLNSMGNLAAVYHSAGRYGDSIPLFERTLKQMRQTLGPDHRDTITVMSNLGGAYVLVSRFKEGVVLLEEALRRIRAKPGTAQWKLDELRSMNNLGSAYRAVGRANDAKRILIETMNRTRARLGEKHPHTLTTMNNVALSYSDSGLFRQATDLYRKVLQLRLDKLGADHPQTLTSMNNVASSLVSLGRYDEAVSIHERALKLKRAKLGDGHPGNLTFMRNLAVAYRLAGRYADAVRLYEQAVKFAGEKLPKNHPVTLASMLDLALAYESAGRIEDGNRLINQLVVTVSAIRKQRPSGSVRFASILASLGLGLLKQGKYDEATGLVRESLRIREKAMPRHWLTFNAKSMLGACLLGRGQLDAAEPLLIDGYRGLEERRARIPVRARDIRIGDALRRLVELYDRKGDPAKAAAWRKRMRSIPVAARRPAKIISSSP